jgi:hypothetical protein
MKLPEWWERTNDRLQPEGWSIGLIIFGVIGVLVILGCVAIIYLSDTGYFR